MTTTAASLEDRKARTAVKAAHAELMHWLLEAAYPIWSTQGVDRLRGGFQERLTLTGEPTNDPRRGRVQPRQLYAFSRAAMLGWRGDSRGVVEQGLTYFLRYFRRPDGLFRTLVAPDGAPLDEHAFLYDQAFALLAFATAGAVLGNSFDTAGEAERLRLALLDHLKHPVAGFYSGLDKAPPLLSNPHMHLLEAALGWLDVGGGDQWQALADELGELALAHLINPATGQIHESFDTSWNRSNDLAGRIIEPGHQYEWAWMLLRWAPHRVDARDAALRLIDNMEAHGLYNGVAVMELLSDTSVHDGTARLWSQTERLRVAARAAGLLDDARYWSMTAEAAESLLRFLATPVRGLWYDRMSPSGAFVPDTVTAGNLYHIVGAIYEIDSLINRRS